MKMKQTKLFLAAFLAGAAMMMVSTKAWADTATDEQYNAAISQITAGDYYIISTVYNETTYYLTTATANDKATLTTDLSTAKAFLFNAGNGTGLKSVAWFISPSTGGRMTNPAGNAASDLKGYLRVETSSGNLNGNRLWESQVLYYDGTHFAIRSTNNPSSVVTVQKRFEPQLLSDEGLFVERMAK